LGDTLHLFICVAVRYVLVLSLFVGVAMAACVTYFAFLKYSQLFISLLFLLFIYFFIYLLFIYYLFIY